MERKKVAWLPLMLALVMLLMTALPLAGLAEGNTSTRWKDAADAIDKYADTAFSDYLAGDYGKAYKNVSDAYFQIYEITGFERQTLSYINGPRKNAVELQFSACKAAVKKDNAVEENVTAARSALVKLKTMIREDCNKLSVKDGEAVSEISYWKDGQQVDSDPFADYGDGADDGAVHYKTWSEAYDAIDELLDTAYIGYRGRDFESAVDNVNTAYYTVYEESGLSHKIYSEMGIETRESVDATFTKLKDILASDRFQSKGFQRQAKAVKSAILAQTTVLDEKNAAEQAEKAAAAQAAAEAAAQETVQSDPRLLTFLGAFGIIVREGLEAILVIAAIIAYLVKSGNAKNLKNVYIGAVAGIAASFAAAAVLAWAKSTFAAAGMAQEIIEGITALIAVCVLFYVSNWMISKAEAASWSRYIDGKVQSSVEQGSAFALAFTAFLSVFREGAEVVLFYQPMLSEGNPGMVWAGFGVGCVVLVFVYLAITKLSIKLPIKVFFTATSILMAVMCVSFLGSGIKELAEGNVFDVTLQVPGIPENDVLQVLGIYPYLETLVPQLILAIILLITFMIAHYRGKMDALKAEYHKG
ncbi:MAG: FTR1 family iron permease [Clostridia bacterium]|nr:FTR1 family iron permease [Clostridia bacterium]